MASPSVELWAGGDPEEVVALWLAEEALPEDEARRRVRELLAVGRAESGELAAVCTAFLQREEQLGLDLWNLRVYVAAAHRRGALAIDLARTARDELVRRWVAGKDRRGAGVLLTIESPALAQAFPDAVWPRLQFAFVGRTALGQDVRVHYFPGAYAPEPWDRGASPST